jgi:hypothetical protein
MKNLILTSRYSLRITRQALLNKDVPGTGTAGEAYGFGNGCPGKGAVPPYRSVTAANCVGRRLLSLNTCPMGIQGAASTTYCPGIGPE